MRYRGEGWGETGVISDAVESRADWQAWGSSTGSLSSTALPLLRSSLGPLEEPSGPRGTQQAAYSLQPGTGPACPPLNPRSIDSHPNHRRGPLAQPPALLPLSSLLFLSLLLRLFIIFSSVLTKALTLVLCLSDPQRSHFLSLSHSVPILKYFIGMIVFIYNIVKTLYTKQVMINIQYNNKKQWYKMYLKRC